MDDEAWNGPPPRPPLLTVIVEGALDLVSLRGVLLLGAILVCCVSYLWWVVPVLENRADSGKWTRVHGDLRHIADQVHLFRQEQNRFPNSIAELVVRPVEVRDWPQGGYLERLPKDPWGGDYILVLPAGNPGAFYVLSLGADNTPGGEGRDADLRYPENRR